MSVVRRAYLFLAAVFSLQAATWAVIGLLRSLLSVGRTTAPEATAFYIAVLVVATPIFVSHWLVVQRDAWRHREERSAVLRRVYLYGMLALFLVPLLANLFGMLSTAFGVAIGVPGPTITPPGYLEPLDIVPGNLIAIAVLGVLAVYHARLIHADDEVVVPSAGRNGSVRRCFVFAFSTLGLVLTAVATVQVLRWLMVQFNPLDLLHARTAAGSAPKAALARESARALVGLIVWVTAWLGAQLLYDSGQDEERGSILRKVYLYGAILAGVVATVSALGLLLAGVLRRVLGLTMGGDLSGPVPVAIVLGALWAYHAVAVRGDTADAQDDPRQGAVRGLYRYLVAGVGLSAALLGLAGVVQVIVQYVADGTFGDPLREQLAVSTAAILAGASVWLWHWTRAQSAAAVSGADGIGARASVVRKLYLYLFLFLATIVVLTGAVFIVFRLLAMALGTDTTDPEMTIRAAEAAGYCVVGVLVWLYHGAALRADGRFGAADRSDVLRGTRAVVVGTHGDRLSIALADAIRRDLPGMPVQHVASGGAPRAATDVTPPDAALGTWQDTGGDAIAASPTPASALNDCDVILGAWDVLSPRGMVDNDVEAWRAAIAASSATKILLPVRRESWVWAGVDPYDHDELVEQAVHAVRQIASGEPVTPARPLGAGAIMGLVALALVLFVTVVVPIVGFMLQGGIGYLLGD